MLVCSFLILCRKVFVDLQVRHPSKRRLGHSSVRSNARTNFRRTRVPDGANANFDAGRQWAVACRGGTNARDDVYGSPYPLNDVASPSSACRGKRGMTTSVRSATGPVNEAAAGVCAEVVPGVSNSVSSGIVAVCAVLWSCCTLSSA